MSVLKNEETLAHPVLDGPQLTEACEAAVTANADVASPLPVLIASFLFVFSPFIIEGPCLLRVRAETESEELQGIALRIEQVPQEIIRLMSEFKYSNSHKTV